MGCTTNEFALMPPKGAHQNLSSILTSIMFDLIIIDDIGQATTNHVIKKPSNYVFHATGQVGEVSRVVLMIELA